MTLEEKIVLKYATKPYFDKEVDYHDVVKNLNMDGVKKCYNHLHPTVIAQLVLDEAKKNVDMLNEYIKEAKKEKK